MKRNYLYFIFLIITIIFCIFTLFEIYNYMFFNSNLFGLIYLLINCFISFGLIIMCYNFKIANVKIRISKNLLTIILGLFSSFLLYYVIVGFMSYADESQNFINRIFLSVKVFKPILYFALLIFSLLEYKFKIGLRLKKTCNL